MEKEHLEMILEDMSGKFDLVLEGQESLRKEMHGIRDELSEKIESNSFKIDILNSKIDGVASDLRATDERLDRKIDSVEARLSGKIDSVEEKLNKKIDGVEDRLAESLDEVAADLKAHRADTEAHHGYMVRED